MTKLFLILLNFICLCNLVSQASESSGTQLLMQNKITEALTTFDIEIQKNKNNQQALLGKLLALCTLPDDEKTFLAYKNFIQALEDKSPYICAFWTEATNFNSRTELSITKLEFILKLLEDPKIHGSIKAMARIVLAYHYESINEFKNRDKQFEQVGNIENWSILGTFDNTSGSGYSKDWGVINNVGPFLNQNNYPINWFTPGAVRSDRWFDFEYHLNSHNSICYAQSFVKSQHAQTVYLRAGCSGSIKVWVNDMPVIQEPIERNIALDIYIVKVKLNEGYNRILVQIGESEANSSNFLIRLTNENGNAVPNLVSTDQLQVYTKSITSDVEKIPYEMEYFFEQLLQTKKSTVLDSLIYANLLLRNDKVFEARKILKTLKLLYPNSSLLSNYLVLAYVKDNNRTDQTREIEEIKKNDPESNFGIQHRITEASNKNDIDEFEKLANLYKAKFGENEISRAYTIAILSERKLIPELIAKIKEYYKKYPNEKLYAQYMYDIELNESKDLFSATKYLTKYLADHNDNYLLEKAAYNFFKLNNGPKGISMLNQRVDNFKYATAYIEDLLTIYYEAGDYPKALQYCEQILDITPYNSYFHKKKGKIYEALKNKSKAIESFNTAIKLNPKDYDSRKELRKINNQADLYDYFTAIDAKSVYRKTNIENEKIDNSAQILIYNTNRIIYDGGASEAKVELLVKVYNQQGIDTWKEYRIDYNSYSQRVIIESAEVFKKDGGTQKAEVNGSQIAFTDLTPDDAIHLVYKIENYYSGKISQHNWDIFSLQYFIPSKLIAYHILVPSKLKLNSKVLNGNVNSLVTEIDTLYRIYSWNTSHLPELKTEPFMPPLNEIAPTIVYSTIPSWQYVSEWYSDLSSELARQDFEVKETVSDLLRGKENISEYEKAKIFYEYIISNISYSNIPFLHGPIIPQKASITLRTKQGDCKDVSTLFVAMCAEAKLDANLILVNTFNQGKKHLELPGIGFNHCIAQLNIEDKSYYVELTDQKLPFTAIGYEDWQALSLRIPRPGGIASKNVEILNYNTIKLNKLIRNTTAKISGQDMTVTRRNIRYGFFAASQRNSYADLNKEKQEKSFSEIISADFSNQVKLKELRFEQLNTLADSIVTEYTFEVKKAITEVAGFKIFYIPWSDQIRSLDFVNQESRYSSLYLRSYNASEFEEERIVLELPSGSKLQENPQAVNIENQLAEYKLTYDLTVSEKIIAKRFVKYKKNEIQPNEYAEFRDFINRVAEADAKPIAIK